MWSIVVLLPKGLVKLCSFVEFSILKIAGSKGLVAAFLGKGDRREYKK